VSSQPHPGQPHPGQPHNGQPHHGEQVVVAIDIGGAQMRVGLMTMLGELIDRDEVVVDRDLGAQALYESLEAVISGQLDRARDHHGVLPVAVGVGSCGAMTRNAALVSPTTVGAWRDFPLNVRLSASTRLPVFGELDAKALALAEGWLGAAVGHENFIGIIVSTSVSGGIVLNGRLLDGATGHAGSIGHTIVEPNGRRCVCGSRGCLEAEVSGPAIEAITGRSPTQPTYEIMQRTGRLVGRAVATVCNSLDLDLAVVGGSVALGFGATFFNSAQETLDAHARLAYSRGARITPTRLGDRGPLIGAGAFAIRGLRRSRSAAAPVR
jgi:glucokinase